MDSNLVKRDLHEMYGLTLVFSEFTFDPLQWPRSLMDKDFDELSHHFKAEKSIVRVMGSDPDLKLAVLT